MQAAFYATPVLYPLQMVIAESFKAAQFLMLNPVAQIIQDARFALVTSDTITLWQIVNDWRVIIPFAVIILTAIVGGIYFKKKSKFFAEDI